MRRLICQAPYRDLPIRLVLALALLAVGLAGPALPRAHAGALVVANTANAGAGSLRQAITDANPGDTITFGPSLSGGTIVLASPLLLTKNLTIDGSALAEPVTISGNGAVRVLEVTSGTTVTLNGLVIAHGRHNDRGGGLHSEGALTITGCTFSDNNAEDGGGAVYNTGALTVTSSTFDGNGAEDGGGGGISSAGALTVTQSTFVGNSAVGGGAIFAISQTLTVADSTFFDNTAVMGGSGIACQGSLTVRNTTFSGNTTSSPQSGGGALLFGGVLTYTNTIVANSSGGDCVLYDEGASVAAASTNNLVEDGTCEADLNGDPLLGPLADNGGPTWTMALLPGSPALNAGDAATCTASDQRGVARPQGAGCDLGAYEQELPSAVTAPATDLTPTGAVLRGTVNARYGVATVTFEYGVDTSYPLSVTLASPVTGTAAVPVSAAVTGLTPGTTYHYRVVADSGAGTTAGEDATFTTDDTAPSATTDPATDISTTGATLRGTVNANNNTAAVQFWFGETTDYGTVVMAVPSPVTGTTDTAVSYTLTDLAPATTYHYRVVAVSDGGLGGGADATFTTLPLRDLYLPAIRR